MVKFCSSPGYVCVDYYPIFNKRYYITVMGRCAVPNLLDIKRKRYGSIHYFHCNLDRMNTEKKKRSKRSMKEISIALIWK